MELKTRSVQQQSRNGLFKYIERVAFVETKMSVYPSVEKATQTYAAGRAFLPLRKYVNTVRLTTLWPW
jgi:hypothetical protein